jgi:hypothetical protein
MTKRAADIDLTGLFGEYASEDEGDAPSEEGLGRFCSVFWSARALSCTPGAACFLDNL